MDWCWTSRFGLKYGVTRVDSGWVGEERARAGLLYFQEKEEEVEAKQREALIPWLELGSGGVWWCCEWRKESSWWKEVQIGSVLVWLRWEERQRGAPVRDELRQIWIRVVLVLVGFGPEQGQGMGGVGFNAIAVAGEFDMIRQSKDSIDQRCLGLVVPGARFGRENYGSIPRKTVGRSLKP